MAPLEVLMVRLQHNGDILRVSAASLILRNLHLVHTVNTVPFFCPFFIFHDPVTIAQLHLTHSRTLHALIVAVAN